MRRGLSLLLTAVLAAGGLVAVAELPASAAARAVRIVLHVERTRGAYGLSNQFTGSITYRASGGTVHDASGGTAYLQRRRAGHTDWRTVDSTRIIGYLYFQHVSPRLDGNAHFRVRYTGGQGYGGPFAAGYSATVKVLTTRKLDDSGVQKDGHVYLHGTLAPKYAHRPVRIETRSCSTCSWHLYHEGRTGPRSGFTIRVQATTGGKRYRISVPASTRYAHTTSLEYRAWHRTGAARIS